jgi:glycosyltransferase involved in cell wall biosynthesis
LRDRLQTLVSSRALQQQMGLNGRRRYERDFRIEAMVRKTLAVYNEVLLQPQIRLGDAVVKRQEPL